MPKSNQAVMKTICYFIFAFVAHFGFSQTENDLKATDILKASIEFCGGEKRISEFRSTELSYYFVNTDGLTASMVEKKVNGEKYAQSILSKKHTPQSTFFDGKDFTRIDGSEIIRISDLNSNEEIKLKTFNNLQYGYKQLGYELKRLPDEKFENFDCYVVEAKASNGYSTMNFFDKSDFG